MLRDLRGAIAVVTGGGSGIGRGLCQVLAGEEGMDVVIADIDLGAATETADLLAGFGVRALPVMTDVACADSMTELAARTKAELGSANMLCNNAGVLVPRTLCTTTFEQWRWTLSVNLEGVVHGTTAFLPQLRERRGAAHIVNTASIAGLAPLESRLGAYAASKAAVIAYSEVLRAELEPMGVGVSILLPGRVATAIGQTPGRPPTITSSPIETRSNHMDAVSVARKMVAGVKANRLYVLADPDRSDAADERFRAMREDFAASGSESTQLS